MRVTHSTRCPFDPPCSTRAQMRERHGMPAFVSNEIWKLYYENTISRVEASNRIREYAEDYLRATPDPASNPAELDHVNLTRETFDEWRAASLAVVSCASPEAIEKLRSLIP